MKSFLSLLLTAVLLLSCLSSFGVLAVSADSTEDISGVQTVSFAKNGVGSSPYMSGLNVPVGYAFKVDPEKRLLSISIPEFATYNNNTNKGTFKLYEWKGDRNATVAASPIAEMEIIDHVDHDTLTLDIPADKKITGHLYFEVICLEGTSYTPWNAEGGLVDPIPGVVTDMQAYLGGNPANPFACEITVCDMENRSASAYVTFTYDFAKGLTDGADVNQKNQIRFESKQGYVTFIAEGEDPYIRFADNYQPTPPATDLAYAVIEYRTTAAIAAGEIYTNRRSGAHWGDPGSHVTWNYVPDGEWHTVVVDASEVWGNAEGDELYAFRLDPLSSGARAGDEIDIASVKFFGDGVYARSYAADREATIRDDESLQVAEGSFILDFALSAPPAGCVVGESMTSYWQSDFTRLIAENSGEIVLAGQDINADFRYLQLVCRTEALDGPLTVTVHSGEQTASAELTPVTDGFWQSLTAELPAIEGAEALDQVTLTLPTGWVDMAYLGFFEKAEYPDKYVYPSPLTTHQYVLGDTDVPVYNVTDPTLGSPFCGGGQSMGQKFLATGEVRGIIIPGHATWGADPNNNSGYFKLFRWSKDYSTTVSSTPLVERELKNLRDGEDLVITFDALPAGEYCFEIKMTTPGDKAYTGFNSANGTATEGTVSFRNGAVNSDQLVAGYLTTGVGLQDVGDEYGMDVTFAYDFTRHYDSITEAMGLSNMNGMTVTDLCDQGYLSITAMSNDPFLTFGVDPTVTSNLMDHVVIKYRTTSSAKCGELFVDRSDGATWGSPYEKTNMTWDWQADGEWHIAVIDASAVWGNVYGVTLENLRFDPLEKPAGEGETIDVAYIKFFANERAAEAFAATEYVEEDGKTVVKPPLRPIDPTTVVPAWLIEGEDLNVEGGTQMQSAEYSYDRGFITYTAKGNDPSFFLFREPTVLAPFMAIKYRTSTRGAGCEVYVGSVQSGPSGRSDRITYTYTADGEWHIAVIDLRKAADFDADTGKANYLRFDFLHSDSGLGSGATVDVEYVGFFGTYDEAVVYPHTLPVEKSTYVATFVVDGKVLYKVEFREGDTSLEEPVVPVLPGMVGVWESYTLNDADITVNAIYTAVESDVPDVPPLPSEETDVSTDTSEPTEPAETQPPLKKGCRSTLGLCPVCLLLLAAAVGKKRDRA